MTEHHEQHEHHEDAPQAPDLSAAGWDARYAGEPVWSGNPNQALVAEVTAMAHDGTRPGTALDIGCGEGADAVWLAQQGWQVTALDISGNAVGHTLRAARAAGVEVEGLVGAFDEVVLDDGSYDLVSAMYPVLDKRLVGLDELVDLVAPGGSLLLVHHAELDHAREHGWNPDDFWMPADLARALAGNDGWQVVVDEQRGRHVASGGGAGHTVDHVVRVRRA